MQRRYIALVGRPNTGKSQLMNALVGYRRSIVLDKPHTTVDDLEAPLKGYPSLILIDTPGVDTAEGLKRIAHAHRKPDAVLWLVENKGLLPSDWEMGRILAQLALPVLLCVNKSEADPEGLHFDWKILSHSDPVFISAAHHIGLENVVEWILRQTSTPPVEEETRPNDKPMTVLLLGRPNRGKSTLMNRLCCHPTSQVSPEPRTTQDCVSFELTVQGKRLHIIDSSGLSRKNPLPQTQEYFAASQTMLALRKASAVLLLLSAGEEPSVQDRWLLDAIQKRGRPLGLLFNFWDQLSASSKKDFWKRLKSLPKFGDYPALPLSAKTGWNADKVLPLALELVVRSQHRLATSRLNRVLASVVAANPPPSFGRGRFHVLYGLQAKSAPPTFVFFVRNKDALPGHYAQYLTNALRQRLHLPGQSLRVFFKDAK